MRRLLLGAVLLILACGGGATLTAPSQSTAVRSSTPIPTIDVYDMMGAFPAATFFVVTDEGVKALALLNHATKFTVPTTGAVQVAAGDGLVYVADETAEGTRLRWIDVVNGRELATSTERGRKLVATGIGHGALVVEPRTNRLLALYYADGDRRVVEAYEPFTLRSLGRRLEADCGDRLLAGADRVVLPCYAAGTLVIKDTSERTEPRVVNLGLGTLQAAAISLDGTTLVGRDDGTLARVPPRTFSVEQIEPFRTGRLVPDGIASPESQNFAIALATDDLTIGISELRQGRRYISFPNKEVPIGGLLALGPFAYWSDGASAKHIDLRQGFAETMATMGGLRVRPGGIGAN